MFGQFFKDEKILSFFGTIFIHVIIVTIFLLIKIKFSPVMEEFTEVTLAGGFEAAALDRLREPQIETDEMPQFDESATQRLPEDINLPERRELDLDEQTIMENIQPEFEKFVTPGNIFKKSINTLPPFPRSAESEPTFTRQEKPIEQGLFRKELDEKILQGTQRVDINVDRNFEIDWEGEIKREIYHKRLPEFPPDVQREATIKIQFSLLPNGLVGSALLLQKGDTKLENLTLEAFKTWRFNPLPDHVDRVQQTGVITFRFKLK